MLIRSSSQALEMAETTSDVYDIFHATPVSLKDLAAFAISLEVWRCEINKYRQSGTVAKFFPFKKQNSLKSQLPDLPTAIYKKIEEYFITFGRSIKIWSEYHYAKFKFHFGYSHPNGILEVFDDFVYNYFGEIDYARTAKRMMNCDRFSVDEKFIVACVYFFEDDVRMLWPSVSDKMHLNNIRFRECPPLYYWICCLTNQLDRIPTNANSTIDESMYEACLFYRNGPSIMYFWNRIQLKKKTRGTVDLVLNNPETFVRFVLSKLDDQQLDEFVNMSGLCDCLMNMLWRDYENLLLGTWSYIKNVMTEIIFTDFVVRMLEVEEYYKRYVDERATKKYLFHEVWNSARADLKRSVIKNISSGLLEGVGLTSDINDNSVEIDAELLSIILLYASVEERISFWRNFWHLLVISTPVDDLQQIMNACFENEDEILRFKQNSMTRNNVVQSLCVSYLTNVRSDAFDEFVSFCCPESQTARTFRQQILRSTFLNENTCAIHRWIPCNLEAFGRLIDEAFNDVHSSAAFKDQVLSLPCNQLWLCAATAKGELSFEQLIKFIDSFASTERTVSQIKLRMIDCLKQQYGSGTFSEYFVRGLLAELQFTSILSWCIGSDEEIEKLKLTFTYTNDGT